MTNAQAERFAHDTSVTASRINQGYRHEIGLDGRRKLHHAVCILYCHAENSCDSPQPYLHQSNFRKDENISVTYTHDPSNAHAYPCC